MARRPTRRSSYKPARSRSGSRPVSRSRVSVSRVSRSRRAAAPRRASVKPQTVRVIIQTAPTMAPQSAVSMDTARKARF